MNTIKRFKSLNSVLAISIACATAYSSHVFAVASSCSNCQGVSYGVVGGNTGEFSVSQGNAVAEFTENVSSLAGETYHFEGSQAGQVLLVKDLSNQQSSFAGSFTGDGNVSVFFENTSGIVFGSGSSVVNIPNLTATTYSVNESNGVYSLNNSGGRAQISIEGLQSTGNVALVGNRILINGSVDLAGNLDVIAAGGTVQASFDNSGLLQFEFDQASALDTVRRERIIDVFSGASVNAANVVFNAWVDDPASFAINNQGVIAASGISVGEGGKIVLNGGGGTVQVDGTLDTSDTGNGDGDIEISAVKINLGGELTAGNGSLALIIGDTGDTSVSAGGTSGNVDVQGILNVREKVSLTFSSMTVQGLGQLNAINGLANYVVSGNNSGTAAYQGVGASDWRNVGAVQFFDVAQLLARKGIENTLIVQDGAVLLQSYRGQDYGDIHGGNQADIFRISGEVQSLYGEGESDTFVLNGNGNVLGVIDGGNSVDTLIDVVNPIYAANGFDGSSDNVANWINIENVAEYVPPAPQPEINNGPSGSIIAPQVSFVALNSLANNAVLGLVGDDINPRLPCGFRGEVPTANEMAAAEEDCLDAYNTPEYQALLSSIIHFDNDSSEITLASARRLNKVSEFVIESDMFETVRISGHTDSNASDTYNMALSERRALSASSYMQSQGVNAELIETEFFGERLPAVPNTTLENRAKNRRAVIELKR